MTSLLLASRRYWAIAAVLALVPLLPGCTPAPSDIGLNTIVVKPVAASYTVHFAPGSAALAPAENAGLRAFLDENRHDRIRGITLVSGSGSIADARRARVGQALAAAGFAYRAAPADASFTGDAVLVTVDHIAAVPPACPNWTVTGPYDPSNAPLSNLGCATRTDLYLMVADPHDLVAGRAAPAEAAPSMEAVAGYRQGKLSPGLGAADGSAGGAAGGTTTTGGSSGQ